MTAASPIVTTHALRPYQSRSVQDATAALQAGQSPVLVMPTGGGKTHTATTILHNDDQPTLWLAHRRELVTQAADSLRDHGMRPGLIMSGYPRFPACPLQVASIQTLRGRTLPAVKRIVIDECHRAVSASYRKLLDSYPGVPVLGLTATPFRLDGRPLADLFNNLIVAAFPDELCRDGYLIEPRVFAPPTADTSELHIRAGDYASDELGAAMDKPRLVGDVAETWMKHARGKPTLLFAVNVEHSQHFVAEFARHGIRFEHIDGTTPLGVRKGVIARLERGEIEGISNCDVYGEGVDIPWLECLILARPTASLCLHLQQVGRVMRTFDGADPRWPHRTTRKASCVCLDHAGNFLRHGRVTRRLAYSLEGAIVAASEPSGLRTCPVCFRMYLATRTTCPECGAEAAVKPRELPKHEAGELVELVDGGATSADAASAGATSAGEAGDAAPAAPRYVYTREQREGTFERLTRVAAAHQFKPGFVAYKFREEFGVWPLVVDIDGTPTLADPENPDERIRRAVLDKYVAEGQAKGFKPGYGASRYREHYGEWPRFSRTRTTIQNNSNAAPVGAALADSHT